MTESNINKALNICLPNIYDFIERKNWQSNNSEFLLKCGIKIKNSYKEEKYEELKFPNKIL